MKSFAIFILDRKERHVSSRHIEVNLQDDDFTYDWFTFEKKKHYLVITVHHGREYVYFFNKCKIVFRDRLE